MYGTKLPYGLNSSASWRIESLPHRQKENDPAISGIFYWLERESLFSLSKTIKNQSTECDRFLLASPPVGSLQVILPHRRREHKSVLFLLLLF
jgi:hypothetical protein